MSHHEESAGRDAAGRLRRRRPHKHHRYVLRRRLGYALTGCRRARTLRQGPLPGARADPCSRARRWEAVTESSTLLPLSRDQDESAGGRPRWQRPDAEDAPDAARAKAKPPDSPVSILSVSSLRSRGRAGHNRRQRTPASPICGHAFGLQNGCSRAAERGGGSRISLQMAGGRPWIRTRDLFLIRAVDLSQVTGT